MTQQFKFGDRVYFPSNVEEIGIVIQVLNSENKIVVAWNDGEQTTEAIDDMQLTIIPHPDTVRLDFIQNSSTEIQFYRSNDDDDDDYDTEWFSLSTPRWDLRETIDTKILEYEDEHQV